jgi:hypothetical protein
MMYAQLKNVQYILHILNWINMQWHPKNKPHTEYVQTLKHCVVS